MTLEEAKAIARTVLDNRTRSHVQSASELAAFVLSIRGIRGGDIEDAPARIDPHALDADEL